MRIIYHPVPAAGSDTTEEHIARGFRELGHEVASDGDGDLFLFHKTFNPPEGFTGKTACWYFDKVEWEPAKHRRVPYIKEVLEEADFLFMTDETWAMENPNPKIRILRQGIGDPAPGTPEPRDLDVAFVGNPYWGRDEWCQEMMAKYGDRFKIYSHKFNRELNDLCASVPIFTCPKYPSDNYYWSNRVYLLVGSGAFLIHPYLEGLHKEWGDNLVYYKDIDELHALIAYYLAHPEEREAKRKQMYDFCVNNFTYTHRVAELIKHVQAH